MTGNFNLFVLLRGTENTGTKADDPSAIEAPNKARGTNKRSERKQENVHLLRRKDMTKEEKVCSFLSKEENDTKPNA